MSDEYDCTICGVAVTPEVPGCSIINGRWVHNDCVIGSEKNLRYMLNLIR